ncbi:hypothetical protein MTO96_036444 [Rhipicephalus appendiculatus]
MTNSCLAQRRPLPQRNRRPNLVRRKCSSSTRAPESLPAKTPPIVSRGYYALPGDHDPTRQNPALSHASPMLRPSRETDRPATSPERGREQRTRSRSRRRTGDEDKRDEKMGTGNKDTSMRRPGPEARGSDSDAPPQAKAPKLGKSAAGNGDPPPKARDTSR